VTFEQYKAMMSHTTNIYDSLNESISLWNITAGLLPASKISLSTLNMAQSGLSGLFHYQGNGTVRVISLDAERNVLSVDTYVLPDTNGSSKYPFSLHNGTQYFEIELEGNVSIDRVVVRDPYIVSQHQSTIDYIENNPANYDISLGEGADAPGPLLLVCLPYNGGWRLHANGQGIGPISQFGVIVFPLGNDTHGSGTLDYPFLEKAWLWTGAVIAPIIMLAIVLAVRWLISRRRSRTVRGPNKETPQ
jgi:hypothetical protein